MVERPLRMREVMGSIPMSSILLFVCLPDCLLTLSHRMCYQVCLAAEGCGHLQRHLVEDGGLSCLPA